MRHRRAAVVLIAGVLCAAVPKAGFGYTHAEVITPLFSLGVTGDALVVIYHEVDEDTNAEKFVLRDWLQVHDTATGRLRWQKVVAAESLDGPGGYWGRGAACGNLLYVPHSRRIDALGLRDGVLKASMPVLDEDSSWASVRCNRNRVMVAEVVWTSGPKPDPTVVVNGFDAATLRPVWHRTFPHAQIEEGLEWGCGYAGQMETGRATADSFQLPLCDAAEDGYWWGGLKWYQQVTMRAHDGAVLSRQRVIWPFDAACTPTTPSPDTAVEWLLPDTALEWLYRLTHRPWHGSDMVRVTNITIFTGRTHILKRGGLAFVGNHEVPAEPPMDPQSIPSRLFAIRPETAKVVWQRKLPGLSDIILSKETLFAVCDTPRLPAVPQHKSPRESRPRVVALDAKTGRVLWAAVVATPRPPATRVYLCAAITLGFGCLVWCAAVMLSRRRRQRRLP